jgi:hypothetical protein
MPLQSSEDLSSITFCIAERETEGMLILSLRGILDFDVILAPDPSAALLQVHVGKAGENCPTIHPCTTSDNPLKEEFLAVRHQP